MSIIIAVASFCRLGHWTCFILATFHTMAFFRLITTQRSWYAVYIYFDGCSFQYVLHLCTFSYIDPTCISFHMVVLLSSFIRGSIKYKRDFCKRDIGLMNVKINTNTVFYTASSAIYTFSPSHWQFY